jgi:hypothetical protein
MSGTEHHLPKPVAPGEGQTSAGLKGKASFEDHEIAGRNFTKLPDLVIQIICSLVETNRGAHAPVQPPGTKAVPRATKVHCIFSGVWMRG